METQNDTVGVEPDARRRTGFKVAIVVVTVLGVVAALALYYRLFGTHGVRLNTRAWEATFSDRDLEPPRPEPREGYWGPKAQAVKDPLTEWRLGPWDEPGVLEIDENGFQHAGPESAPQHVIILGGSVGFGAYATNIENTYFDRLAALVNRDQELVRITNLSTGGWSSVQELKQLRARGLGLDPDIVLFVHGVNDLTERRKVPLQQRVDEYLQNARAAVEEARGVGADVVFAPQPMILEKRNLSWYEERIVDLTFDDRQWTYPGAPREEVKAAFRAMIEGVEDLARDDDVTVVDCSRLVADEEATSFADFWHFADPVHELLAQRLSPTIHEIATRRLQAGDE